MKKSLLCDYCYLSEVSIIHILADSFKAKLGF